MLDKLIQADGVVSIRVAVLEDDLNNLDSVVFIDSLAFEEDVHLVSVDQSVAVSVECLKISPESKLLIVSFLLSIHHVHFALLPFPNN